MSRRVKILLSAAVLIGLLLILFAAFGSAGKNDQF